MLGIYNTVAALEQAARALGYSSDDYGIWTHSDRPHDLFSIKGSVINGFYFSRVHW